MFADGASLSDNATTTGGKVQTNGIVRLDIYVPFGHKRYLTIGSTYDVKLRIKDRSGAERMVVASTVVN